MGFLVKVLKKPRFLVVALAVFNVFGVLGQTTLQAEQITATYDFDKLIEIKSRFQKENEISEKKVRNNSSV